MQQNKGQLLDKDIQSVHDFEKAIDALTGAKKKQEKFNSATLIGNVTGTRNDMLAQAKQLVQAQKEFDNLKITFGKNTTTTTGLINQEFSVVSNGQLQKWVATINQATGAVTTLLRAEDPYISQGQKFINSIKGKFAELTRYVSLMSIFQKALSFVKQGITAVREIDTAMTELKKVTDETTTSYDKFAQTAGKVATEVGGTTSDIISSTADYARLGYDLEESTELAKNTAIYKNVGDGIDIDTATEDIVSITKAYGIAAEKSMEVIDVLNEVGNSYAISSSGIGESLKRSSSTLAAGNNTFEESVAMLTAMNEVLQDPALAGTTLKMLSLRIRGKVMPSYTEKYMLCTI